MISSMFTWALDHGYRYGHNAMGMGTGTGTGTSPACQKSRVRVRDQVTGTGTNFRILIRMGTGMGKARTLAKFTQLKRNKSVDNFIMLVGFQRSLFHISAGSHPVQKAWGSQGAKPPKCGPSSTQKVIFLKFTPWPSYKVKHSVSYPLCC